MNRAQRRKAAKMVDLYDKQSMLRFVKSLTFGGGKITQFNLQSGATIKVDDATEEQLRAYIRKMLLPNGVQPNRSTSKQNEANQ